jgi:hypothetical protein
VVGWQLLAPLMGAMIVEVVEVLADHGLRVAFVVGQDVVEARWRPGSGVNGDVARLLGGRC